MNLKRIINDLRVSITTKLTANKAEKQTNSIAVDVPGVVTDLNKLIAALKASGQMEE